MGNAIGISNGAGIANASMQSYPHSYGGNASQNNISALNAAYNHNLMVAQQRVQQVAEQQRKKFMIEGKEMDLIEFVETLYPEDCPERTYLLLKLKGD